MARFDRAIPPGGEGEVVLTLKTRGYQGNLKKSAMIYSNDPESPQIKLTVSAQVKVPISLEPRGVLLHGFNDEDITAVMTIEAHDDQPLILEPVKLSLPNKVAYDLKSIEEGKVYQVIFRNISKKRDKYSGFLKLKTNYANKPQITVMVFGYIKGSLQLRPETINFGQIGITRLKGQQAGKLIYRRTVMITLNRGDTLKIEKIEINKDIFEAQVQEIQESRRYQIEITLKADKIPKGVLNENMKIYTNLKDESVIVVPISAQKI